MMNDNLQGLPNCDTMELPLIWELILKSVLKLKYSQHYTYKYLNLLVQYTK